MNSEINSKQRPFLVSEGLIFPRKQRSCDVHCPDGKKHFVFIGKTNRRNGIPLILEAARRSKNKDWIFDIYGTGEMDEEIAKTAKETDCLVYHGFVYPEDAFSKMQSANVLLSPRIPGKEYQKFSFPSKILDYLLAKKPIVTFPLPCYPKKFERYFVYPEDATADELLKACGVAVRKGESFFEGLDDALADYEPESFVLRLRYVTFSLID